MNHNHNSIQCNMIGFIDPTFRPMGGPSSGTIKIQFCHYKVHDCVLFLQVLFTFVAMVTCLIISIDTSRYILNCVNFTWCCYKGGLDSFNQS